MNFRIRLSPNLREKMLKLLHQALGRDRRQAKRILAVLGIVDGHSPEEIADRLDLSERSVYNYVIAFLHKGLESLKYKRPPGRKRKLTKCQREELSELIDRGPEAAGYDFGCWTSALIKELIEDRFGVCYSVYYIPELLDTLGYSYQRARFVSDHITDVSEAQEEWMTQTWPEIEKMAQKQDAMILFGDEASFAQWGTLSYTWSRKGQQPTVKTSGKRKAYKVFGLIDYLSGAFFYKTLDCGRFNSERYADFLSMVLAQTSQHLILIQDGARYHTSKAMKEFCEDHADRLTVYQLPTYSPDFNPIEYLWRNVKKLATHLRYHPTFESLVAKVDEKLQHFASLPDAILALTGKYCSSNSAAIA